MTEFEDTLLIFIPLELSLATITLMARRILGRDPGIGKRWPYRILNLLSPTRLWKYLDKKATLGLDSAPFHLGKNLDSCKKILVLVPDEIQEILVALPLLQSLTHDLPGVELQLLAEQTEVLFLAALFGADKVVPINPTEFFWGESHFKDLERFVRAFQPEVVINLREKASPLLWYLLRSSGASMRVQIAPEPPVPLANIRLLPSEPANHLRRYLLAAKLWSSSSRRVHCKWSRLRPSPEHLQEATSRMTAKGLKPESTRIFLWQEGNPIRQRELLDKAKVERGRQGEAKSLLIVAGAGSLFPAPPAPSEIGSTTPFLEVESTGLLLGMFTLSAYTMGINGPLLHLASLADTDVKAYFEPEDAPWDTSFLNPRLEIIYSRRPYPEIPETGAAATPSTANPALGLPLGS